MGLNPFLCYSFSICLIHSVLILFSCQLNPEHFLNSIFSLYLVYELYFFVFFLVVALGFTMCIINYHSLPLNYVTPLLSSVRISELCALVSPTTFFVLHVIHRTSKYVEHAIGRCFHFLLSIVTYTFSSFLCVDPCLHFVLHCWSSGFRVSHKERGFSPGQAVKLLANQFDAFETCF